MPTTSVCATGAAVSGIPLRLEQVRRQAGRAVAVVVGKRGEKCRGRHAAFGGERHDLAPVGLRFFHGLVEIRVEQQIREVGLPCVGLGNLLQESGADDATATENLRNFAKV